MERLLGASQLIEEPQAQQLHAEGLRARFAGDFEGAHTAFDEAIQILRREPDTIDQAVQLARVRRDGGQASMLEAVTTAQQYPLADASEALHDAYWLIKPVLTEGVKRTILTFKDADTRTIQIEDVREELLATQAKTVSLTGRLATAAAVLYGRSMHGNSQEAEEERAVHQLPYGQAHHLFRKSDDGSGLVDHALLGALQERVNGRVLHIGPWLVRAAGGLLRTASADSDDFINALWAIGVRLPHLRSQAAAQWSLLQEA